MQPKTAWDTPRTASPQPTLPHCTLPQWRSEYEIIEWVLPGLGGVAHNCHETVAILDMIHNTVGALA
jgi:hypothetical protein